MVEEPASLDHVQDLALWEEGVLEFSQKGEEVEAFSAHYSKAKPVEAVLEVRQPSQGEMVEELEPVVQDEASEVRPTTVREAAEVDGLDTR